MMNWRLRNSKSVGGILGEKQHKYMMMGTAGVYRPHYGGIMGSL
jgi:hypothetical protein